MIFFQFLQIISPFFFCLPTHLQDNTTRTSLEMTDVVKKVQQYESDEALGM